jgi:hypothetical protein
MVGVIALQINLIIQKDFIELLIQEQLFQLVL